MGRPGEGVKPDLVIAISGLTSRTRWILIEIKGGVKQSVEYARAALYDLLAYRTAFQEVLENQQVYGLGVAWGEGLEPSTESEVLLATPDTLSQAVEFLTTPIDTLAPSL